MPSILASHDCSNDLPELFSEFESKWIWLRAIIVVMDAKMALPTGSNVLDVASSGLAHEVGTGCLRLPQTASRANEAIELRWSSDVSASCSFTISVTISTALKQARNGTDGANDAVGDGETPSFSAPQAGAASERRVTGRTRYRMKEPAIKSSTKGRAEICL